MPGIYHQENQGARNRAHPRADIWNHISDADNNGNHHGIFQAADCHDKKDQHTQNKGIGKLAADKVGKGGKSQTAIV